MAPGGGLLLGIDEAGYGPRLGPLTVGAVALRGPAALAEPAAAGGWALLHDGVVPPGQDDGARVVAGDSKAIHRPGRGIGPLEEQVLAVVHAATGAVPATLGELEAILGLEPDIDAPWRADADTPLPRAADPARVTRRGDRLRAAADAAGIAFAALRAARVPPAAFNVGVTRRANKARALFDWVAPLLDAVWSLPADGARLAVLDKEGGRDRYLPLVCDAFRDARVRRRLAEGAEGSCYEIERRGAVARLLIEARGERHLPVALASMLAKYVRELAMEGWNAYWARAVPGLRPTAGYPQDAERFLAAIEPARAALGIGREVMERCR